MKTYDEKKAAVEIVAYLDNFDGDVQKWEHSFYQIWRYQMGYSFAYFIGVNENRRNGVFVRLIIKPGFKQNVLDMMDDLGYREIKISDAAVGVVYGAEREDCDDVDLLDLDY